MWSISSWFVRQGLEIDLDTKQISTTQSIASLWDSSRIIRGFDLVSRKSKVRQEGSFCSVLKELKTYVWFKKHEAGQGAPRIISALLFNLWIQFLQGTVVILLGAGMLSDAKWIGVNNVICQNELEI